jgi:oligosaccharyltransferase complex subunit alpha (ribophorin I)
MIHYQNNAPFAKAVTAIREIEVSHWGNVAFEEFMEVQHVGAKLKGGFSRFDFQTQRNPASFQGLVALLPHGARNIYYRDQIGNISNSEVRRRQGGGKRKRETTANQPSTHTNTPSTNTQIRHRPHGVELDVEARFPLFGGWKTQFYQGYSVPVQELLTVAGDRYTLTVPFSVPFSEVWVEDLTVKIVLPEWARDIELDVPFEVEEVRFVGGGNVV